MHTAFLTANLLERWNVMFASPEQRSPTFDTQLVDHEPVSTIELMFAISIKGTNP
jgi:hypothetical protein